MIFLKLQVLIATMNLVDKDKIFKDLNIKTNAIVINQVTKPNFKLIDSHDSKFQVYSYQEKGLSKSRNKAIKNSDADICIISDDDMTYVNNYEKIIKSAYEKYPNADIIVFYVESAPNSLRKKSKLKEGRIKYLLSLKVQSVQMTFKRNSIVENNIKFDENFGAGTSNYMGEENIFLYDCLKKGLKIYSVPIKIAQLHDGDSTWFKGFDKKYLEVKGAMFYRMSRLFSELFIIQFAMRRSKLFKPDFNKISMIRNMHIGRKKYKKEIIKNGG